MRNAQEAEFSVFHPNGVKYDSQWATPLVSFPLFRDFVSPSCLRDSIHLIVFAQIDKDNQILIHVES